MKSPPSRALQALLLVEWPLLVVALALTSWGLQELARVERFNRLSGTPQGARSGEFGFNYGTQVVTRPYTRTRTTTLSNADGPSPSVATLTSTTSYPYTFIPYVYGTSYYAEEYSSLGFIPTPVSAFTTQTSVITRYDEYLSETVTFTSRIISPAATSAPAAPARRNWQEPSRSNSHGLYRDNDTPGLIPSAVGVFAALAALLAVRVLLTPVFLAATGKKQATQAGQRKWYLLLCIVSAIAFFATLALVLGIWIPLGYIYDQVLADSPAMQATVAFLAVATLTSFVVVVVVSVALRRIDVERRNGQHARGTDNGADALMREASG